METSKGKIISKSDIILLVVILLLAGVAYFLYEHFAKDGYHVKISVDGKEVETLSLDKDTSYEIQTEQGRNLVIIKEGTVSIKEADCPDKICVKHADIDKVGDTIICLPHKLVVEVVE